MIKTIKNPFHADPEIAKQMMPDDEWIKLKCQWRIDKIQSELGSGVKNCNCKKCYALRLVTNQVIMLAFSLEVNELEYESEKRVHKKKKSTG